MQPEEDFMIFPLCSALGVTDQFKQLVTRFFPSFGGNERSTITFLWMEIFDQVPYPEASRRFVDNVLAEIGLSKEGQDLFKAQSLSGERPSVAELREDLMEHVGTWANYLGIHNDDAEYNHAARAIRSCVVICFDPDAANYLIFLRTPVEE